MRTRALLMKELRALWPIAALLSLLAVLDATQALVQYPDMLPLEATLFSNRLPLPFELDRDERGLLTLVLAFAVGTGLSTRERLDGTLAFLDGLPVSRTRVFVIKVAAAVAVLSLMSALVTIKKLGLHLLSAGSLDREVHWLIPLEIAALEIAAIVEAVLAGAAFGLTYAFAWMLLGVVVSAVMVVIAIVPGLAFLNPATLFPDTVRGDHAVFDPLSVIAAVGFSALFGFAAWLGFRRAPSERVQLALRPTRGVLIGLGSVTSLVAAAALTSYVSRSDERTGTKDTSTTATAASPNQTTTEHYVFSVPSASWAKAPALINVADETFEQVRTMLELEPTERISVDLSGAERNSTGTTYSDRVRMKLDDDARQVLAHETTHVLSRRVVGDHGAARWSRAPALAEGLATYVERRFATTSTRDAELLVLAALHRRGELRFEWVAAWWFENTHDFMLHYMLGAEVIESLVAKAGPDAPRKLLNAFATPSLPNSLHGIELWRTTFQLAGVDYPVVTNDVLRRVEAVAQAHEAQIAALPRPRAFVVQRADGTIGVRLRSQPPPEGMSFSLRFRPGWSSPRETYATFDVAPGATIWRSAENIRLGRVCVQPGVKFAESKQTLYERWDCMPVDGAAPVGD